MEKKFEKIQVRTSGINGKVAKFKKVVTVVAGTPGVARGFVEVRYANTIEGTYMGEWLESIGDMKVYEKVGRSWVEVAPEVEAVESAIEVEAVESAIEPEVEAVESVEVAPEVEVESAIEAVEVEAVEVEEKPINNTRYYRGCSSAKDAELKVEVFHFNPGRTGMVEGWMDTIYYGDINDMPSPENEHEAIYTRYYTREMDWEHEKMGDWQVVDGRYSSGYWKAAARYAEPVCR